MSMFEQKGISFINDLDFKIAISDLDGTLLDENQRIPGGTIETIKNFKLKGGLFTIASGRNEISVKPLNQAPMEDNTVTCICQPVSILCFFPRPNELTIHFQIIGHIVLFHLPQSTLSL